uniref:glutathione transferase n=1 Tax=Mola mola TaxID=94237 RepID=A0A3Q3WT83_MOLML
MNKSRLRRTSFVSCQVGDGGEGEAVTPDYDKSGWFGVKNKLGLDFPNLPYLVDGDKKIVQSNAIMRYIARKHNMCK